MIDNDDDDEYDKEEDGGGGGGCECIKQEKCSKPLYVGDPTLFAATSFPFGPVPPPWFVGRPIVYYSKTSTSVNMNMTKNDDVNRLLDKTKHLS